MKRFFKIIFLFILVGIVAYQNSQTVRARLDPFITPAYEQISVVIHKITPEIVLPPKPCTAPIKYNIDRFDSQFGISKVYFLSATKDAELVWESASGKNLFDYTAQPGLHDDILKVNLVYDYRQQATAKLQSLGINVKNDQTSYDSLKAKYAAIQAQYLKIKATYDTAVTAFNQKSAAYQQKVEYWNTHGGAPEKEFHELAVEKQELENTASQLKITERQINNMVEEINALVVVLNQLAGKLNIAVDQYNAIGATRGESFEEGLYESGLSGRKIDIYEFSDREKLVRVLAHELGHALGLAHVSDPKAIMYSYNSGSNSTPTLADMTELKKRCQIK